MNLEIQDEHKTAAAPAVALQRFVRRRKTAWKCNLCGTSYHEEQGQADAECDCGGRLKPTAQKESESHDEIIVIGWDTESTSSKMRATKGCMMNPAKDTGWKNTWVEVLEAVKSEPPNAKISQPEMATN